MPSRPTIESAAQSVSSNLGVTSPQAAVTLDVAFWIQLIVSILSTCKQSPKQIKNRCMDAVQGVGPNTRLLVRRRILKHLKKAGLPRDQLSAAITAIVSVGQDSSVAEIAQAMDEAKGDA